MNPIVAQSPADDSTGAGAQPQMKSQPLILVVEDDENDALLIRRAFQKAEITNPCHYSSSGEAAMAYLLGMGEHSDRQRHPLPGLVLLDLRLPGLSGFDLLFWIRSHPEFHDLRVVVLSSSDEMRDVNEAYHLGANSFLVKPLELENVDALLWTLRTQRILQREAAVI
jgi:CheY-like chemotaxis protein